MIVNKILASYTFRFMSVYVVSLSVAVLIVLTLVYATYSYDYFKQLHDSITTEIDTLDQVFEEENLRELERLVEEKMSNGELVRFSFLLVDADGQRLLGNIDRWPDYETYGKQWLTFHLRSFSWADDNGDEEYIGRSEFLDNGMHLLVALEADNFEGFTELVSGALFRSMIFTIVLGTIGGAIVAGNSVKQIDRINRTLQNIMTGDLSERISEGGQRGDLNELTHNINLMLERIQQLMEGVRQVSDNIAHDLRTPLTRLRNQLSEMQQNIDAEHEDDVQRLIEEADGLLSTFSSLLRIASIESGSRREGFIRLDPKIILLDVIELYEPLATDKSISLVSSLAENLTINGDRDLLFQAFANLIDNAIKYTQAQGQISVVLDYKGDEVIVSVVDSGVGIPQADREKVFRRFFRVEESRGLEPGNGLGLSLVSAVVKLHHGNIVMSENSPGLRVQVTLPIA